MDFPKDEVGRRIRYLRRMQALTAEELAKRAGVSQSMISQIERGQVSPSLETLWKLSHCLKVPVFSFFETEDQEVVTIMRKGEQQVLKRVRPNILYQLLAPSSGKQISFFKLILEPGEDIDSPLMFHSGEECGYMVQGSMRIEVDGNMYILHEGDSIYFDSNLPHRFLNKGDSLSMAVWAMTHPF
jgi:transcriptional regulator with XRE-family HTH domain